MKTLNITLKKVTISNLIELKEISRSTYAEAFSEGNSIENMTAYLNTSFTNEQLQLELNNPDSEFFFAMNKDIIVGYIKINIDLAQTDIHDPIAMELERIYVIKEYQGKSIGRLLLNKVIDIAKEKNKSYLWLGVWNQKKKQYDFIKIMVLKFLVLIHL